MKIEYRILRGATAQSLEEQVNDLCNNDGFMPQGGASVLSVGTRISESALRGGGMIQENEILFTQAMVKVTQ